jgi:site-specific recombinase XerD
LLTPEQVLALCRAPDPSTFAGLRDRAVLLTLATSGIRIHEAAGLTRPDIISLGQGWGLRVLGKGQADYRPAPLSPEAYGWIQRWLTARDTRLTSAWVFTACTGVHRPTGQPLYPPTSACW